MKGLLWLLIFEVKTLWCASNNNYDKDINDTGYNAVALGLIVAMVTEKKSQDKKKFDVEAMETVDAMMGHARGGCGISEINTAASAFTDASQTTNGQDSLCAVATLHIQRNVPTLRQDSNRLKLCLRELSPSDALFSESAFSDTFRWVITPSHSSAPTNHIPAKFPRIFIPCVN